MGCGPAMEGAVEVGRGGGLHAGLKLLGWWGGGWWSAEDGVEVGGTGVGDVGMVVLGMVVSRGGWEIVGTCCRCQLAGFGLRTFGVRVRSLSAWQGRGWKDGMVGSGGEVVE